MTDAPAPTATELLKVVIVRETLGPISAYGVEVTGHPALSKTWAAGMLRQIADSLEADDT